MPPTTWLQILDRYGIPLGILVIVAWFGYKRIWPLILQQITDAQRRLDRTTAEFLKSNGEFVQALKEHSEVMHNGFERINDRLDDISPRKRAPRK